MRGFSFSNAVYLFGRGEGTITWQIRQKKFSTLWMVMTNRFYPLLQSAICEPKYPFDKFLSIYKITWKDMNWNTEIWISIIEVEVYINIFILEDPKLKVFSFILKWTKKQWQKWHVIKYSCCVFKLWKLGNWKTNKLIHDQYAAWNNHQGSLL